MKTPRTLVRKGFTLIEIMVAVAILATLAAMMWEANGWIQSKALKSQAENEIKLLEGALNQVKADNGGALPLGRGDEFSSHVLYRTLNCDEDNNGEPDKDDTGATRMPYCDLSVIKTKKDTEETVGIPVRKAKITGKDGAKRISGKFYLIFDPWGNPYRYRLGFETEDEKGRAGDGINPDFDIFSLGADGLGDGLTNDGDNADNVTNVRTWK